MQLSDQIMKTLLSPCVPGHCTHRENLKAAWMFIKQAYNDSQGPLSNRALTIRLGGNAVL